MTSKILNYLFNDCDLNLVRQELMVKGRVQRTEPQVFDLLHYMLVHRDRLITHDDLIDAVWAGRVVSDSAVSARISAARHAVGDTGASQSVIKTVPRKGFRFIATVQEVTQATPDAESPAQPSDHADLGAEEHQTLRFCKSKDGTSIAFAISGQGPTLVRAGHWLTHLEQDWRSPIWRPFLNRLGSHYRVVRYDQRGNGLSDWNVSDFTLDRFVEDLEAVIDAGAIEQCLLYGTSQGVPIALAYAAKHPDRVERLILHGGYACGRLVRDNEAERQDGEAILTLMQHGWGKAGSPFLKAFATMFIPAATQQQTDSLVALQRLTTSGENALALRRAVDQFDVRDLLNRIHSPTLILHSRDDGVHPLEQGRVLAAGIAGSEFVLLDSSNHVILPQEPAWGVFFDELTRFTRQ